MAINIGIKIMDVPKLGIEHIGSIELETVRKIKLKKLKNGKIIIFNQLFFSINLN